MIGILHWLSFQLILLISKFQRPEKQDWRKIKVKTIKPEKAYSINEISANLLKQLKKNHNEKIGTN